MPPTPDLAPLRSAWWRVVRLWRPMAGWTLLVWAAAALILTPLTSAVVSWGVLRGDRSVIGNEELIAWLPTPIGLLWLLLVGGLAAMGAVIQYAGLFHIVTDDLQGHRATIRRTALHLVPQIPALHRLAVAAVALGILLALPLVAGLALVRALFLADFDINYYLAEQPPELRRALVAATVWAALWLPGALFVAGRVILALPAYLDGHRPLRVALRRARDRSRGSRRRLFGLLGAALAGWILARLLLDAALLALGSTTVGWVAAASSSLRPVVLASTLHLAASVAVDTAVSILGFAFVATVLTKFYYEDTGLHDAVPVSGRFRDLPFRAARKLSRRLRRRYALPLAAMVAAASILVSGRLLDRLPEPRPVAITAHRAGPAPAPENTLAALEQAIAAGADRAEIDVQRTRDGQVVVVHDADLMRVAGDPRRIAETNYAALADVVQYPDDGSPPAGRRVATLGEFLERARGRIDLMIELKYYGPDPGLAEAVVREVRGHGMEGEVSIISLDLQAVRQVQRLAPDLPTGYVVAAAVGDPARLPVTFLAVSRGRATPRLLRTARARDLPVHVWTINQAAAMARLIEDGADGLITDDPALAVQVRDELAGLSPAARLVLRVQRSRGGRDSPSPQ